MYVLIRTHAQHWSSIEDTLRLLQLEMIRFCVCCPSRQTKAIENLGRNLIDDKQKINKQIGVLQKSKSFQIFILTKNGNQSCNKQTCWLEYLFTTSIVSFAYGIVSWKFYEFVHIVRAQAQSAKRMDLQRTACCIFIKFKHYDRLLLICLFCGRVNGRHVMDQSHSQSFDEKEEC